MLLFFTCVFCGFEESTRFRFFCSSTTLPFFTPTDLHDMRLGEDDEATLLCSV